MSDGVEALVTKSQAGFQSNSLVLGKPRVRIKNLKSSLRFSCRRQPIIDSFISGLFSDYLVL